MGGYPWRWRDRRVEHTTDSTIRVMLRHVRMGMIPTFYAGQRVGHDQPAVDGDGEPLMVINGLQRPGG